MRSLVGGSSIQWLGTMVGCRSARSGGQAPALHFPSLPLWISALRSSSYLHFRTNRSRRLAPAHQGMKMRSLVGGSSIQWLGTMVGCRSARSGGQAPALHFPSLPLWISALRSSSYLHFRTNRSCRMAPAHQGMKMRSLVGGSSLRWLGTRGGCWPAGSGGQASALHSPFRENGDSVRLEKSLWYQGALEGEWSGVTKQRRERDDDERGPYTIDWQVRRLPTLESCERASAAQESGIEPCRPGKVDEKDEVFAQGGDLVGGETEL